ncbi:MAG: class I SAM-dependent methyltransferase [Gemmatimonadaceae bacterium]|nr:class I SAM-dependent methyltransferase [Gemmatimonadaceae bacterium]
MAEWFETWFDETYLALYPQRDEEEAEHAAELIERLVGHRRVDRVLDLACGAGRHSRALAERWWTAGLDLSEVLLAVARQADAATPLVRGDMRVLPFADATFGLVVNLFTSFGYFDSDGEHSDLIREVGRVTASGGTFVLDYLNADLLSRELIPYDESTSDKRVIVQRRSISEDGLYVTKRISIKGEEREFVERVRLFSRAELQGMMTDAGFDVTSVIGNYDGSQAGDDSPRMILVGTRR